MCILNMCDWKRPSLTPKCVSEHWCELGVVMGPCAAPSEAGAWLCVLQTGALGLARLFAVLPPLFRFEVSQLD